jgi:phytoene synthase
VTATPLGTGEHGIERHSKSFALASKLLSAHTRPAVVALYAWCRRADDAIDHTESAAQPAALEKLRAELARVYDGDESEDAVLSEFARVVRRFGIPRTLPEALLDGMEMDVRSTRYGSWSTLLTYCYRVASTVGLMLCHVLGAKDPRASRHAVHLGIAMQLTNIARDVAEDFARGRLYLPSELLARHGVTEFEPLAARSSLARARSGCGSAVSEVLAVADRYYASADEGLRYLPLRAAIAVSCARSVYSHIGHIIAARGYDILAPRAVVATPQKLWLCVRAVWRALVRRPWFKRAVPSTPHQQLPAPSDVYNLVRL